MFPSLQAGLWIRIEIDADPVTALDKKKYGSGSDAKENMNPNQN